MFLPTESGNGMLEVDPIPCADQRNIPALGRIGDPDDIIASVRVEEGRVGFPTCVVPAFSACMPSIPTSYRWWLLHSR